MFHLLHDSTALAPYVPAFMSHIPRTVHSRALMENVSKYGKSLQKWN